MKISVTRHKMTRTVPGIFAAVILITIRTSDAATCATNFSNSTFVNGFGFKASSQSVKNTANDAFTVGWCAGINNGSSVRPTLDVDFKHPYGIKTITVGSPTNRDSYPYPTNVLVKYIPNGGNKFEDFPLTGGGKLEIKLTGPGSAQTSFSQGIAAKQLQFTIQSYHGEDACLRIDLVGCVENDLCGGVCQNGGLCMSEDHCQCAGGFIGNHCELSACTPEPLGLATGAIKPDQITVSSEELLNNKTELGNAEGKNGWCPLSSDQHPWVTIKLHEPKAVSVFSFSWASRGNAQIMTEFELQYVAPVDSSQRFRTFATGIPSMNGTHIFTVTTSPVMVTDTIRILPTNSTGRSCFKLEIYGCDPKTLCSAGFCLHNGSCIGENVCRCPANFFGDRCEQTRNDIVHTDLTFVNITNNVIITTSTTLQFHITGNVVLQTIQNKPVVIINGTHSSIQLSSTTGPSCVTDVNHCTNGFTFIVDIKFISIVDNTYIVSSGGNVPGHTGITLFYTSNNLHFIVSTTNSMWTLTVPYKPIINVWQHFEITWHKNLGVELIVNGHSLGTNSRPAPQQATAVNLPLCIGCSHTNINVNIHMQITGILSWSIDRTELVNAGIKDPPSSTSAPAPTVSTSPTTTATPSTSSLPFQQYNLTFLSITSNILITPSFNFTLHNKPTLELQNNSHTALVLNCSEKQYVELPDKGIPCLESLADCKDGFTFKMEVMFTKIEPAEKTYLLSSGGDAAGVSGMAIYIHSNQLIFGVKQGMNHWTGMHDMTGIIQTNVWYKIEVSWNATKGILAIIDGQEVIKESKWTPSPSVDKSNPVLIGKTEDSNYTSCMKVRDLFTWTTHRDMLVDHGILPVPSTSTKAPTTSTTTPTTTPTTTTSTTTLPTTTAIPVPIFTWNFTSIVNNVIIGIEYNLTVYGTPVVVNGGLLINSSTQYIEFGKPQQNCLNDPESCIHGLTIQFTLQINKFEENTYFFTSGGQLPDGVGIAVIYRFGRIQFILTTNTSSWFISVTKNHFKPNQYHNITISWNLTIGLEVFVNNILIDSNKVPDNHHSALINATTTYIGKQPDTSVKVEFLLNVVTIWYVHIDILVEQGKCEPPVRPTTPPSTTTNRPTTTGKPTTTTSTTTPSATTAKSTFTSVMTKTTPPDQCPVGCVSIATGTSKPTTTPAPTTAPTTTSTTPTSTTTKQTTTRTTSTTAKPQPTATSAPIVPTPDTATPPPPSTRHPTPDYNVKPIIHVTVEKDKNAYLVCTFEPAKQSGVEITVSLIVEQKGVFVLSVGGNTGKAMFEVSKVNMFLYQKKIQCSVSAKWIGSSVTTTIYYSNIFVPSITVKPGTLIVVEGHSKEFITVTSTIPPQFFCCDGCKAQCQVHIVGTFHYDRYFQTCGRDVIAQALIEGTKPSNFNEQICGYTLTIDNWNQDNKIQVIATVDNRRDGDHRNTMEVVANVYNQPQTAQITVKPNVYTVTTVQVTIKDNDLSPAICKSVNDPHMTTFDGQRYDNMVEGEFILYRHASLPFEVRAFYHKCSSRSHATCNCAVAIKSGDDVITITGCQGTVSGGHPGQGHGLGLIFQQIFGSHGNAHGHDNKDELAKTPMTIQIYKNGELTPGTHIRRFGCGQKYEILLPTGMIVAVEQSWKPFINIWITASSFDWGNSEGLCGNFDGNRGNDIKGNVNSFIQLWKAPSGYFFFGVGVSSHTVTSNFCSCVKDKNKICLPGLGAMRCESYRVDSDITATLVLHAKLPILTRTKRQAVVATDAPNTDIVPDAVQMSYEQAVANCTDAIGKNRVTQACTPILTANISEQIDNCAHDYNATGNFEWATDALRDIVVDCVNTANMLIAANASGNTNVTDELPAIPDNIDEILGNACVDKCSEHSNCSNGVCVCNPGYSGVTCDISKQTTPTVAQAPYMCDISVTSDCMAAVMYGDNFVESEDLTCHFEYVQVSNKVTPTGETGKSKAVYISINQVTCLLPKLLSARISISNDGKTQSNMSSIHVAYNSICHDCSAEDSTSVPSCIRKENNCVINGVCFAEGATRPGDNCQVCKSAATSSDWSKNNIAECMPVPVEAEKVSSDDDKKKVLALAIVCGVLAAILLIALIYALRVRAAKKSSKGEFGEYDVASQQHKLHRNNYDNPVMYESNPTYNEKM